MYSTRYRGQRAHIPRQAVARCQPDAQPRKTPASSARNTPTRARAGTLLSCALTSRRVTTRTRALGSREESGGSSDGGRRLELKRQLLELLGEGTAGSQRVARVADSRKQLEAVVEELCTLNPTLTPVESPGLLGSWQLLTTYKSGTADVSFWSVESWRKYIYEQGPSPVQSLVLSNSTNVSNVSQILESPSAEGSKWQNVVSFGQGNKLVIEAALEGIRDDSSFFYRFSGGFFLLSGETAWLFLQ